MVENPKFAIGVSRPSVVAPEIYIRFWLPCRYFRLSVTVAITFGHIFELFSLIVRVYHSIFIQTFVVGSERRIFFCNRVRIGRSGSSKVVDFGVNRKSVCDFLLVIYSNFAPISEIRRLIG